MKLRLLCLSAILALTAASAAVAGPPFATDDPVPTDTGHYEIYAFAAASHIPGETGGATGFDLNYGPIKDVQLTATLPLEFATGQPLRRGDVELGVKLRLLHQDKQGIDLAIFPRAILPTSAGARRVDVLLPVWAERDWGKWALFGGGGYMLHGGPGNRNYWLAAAALTRQASKSLLLGGELYSHGPDSIGAHRYSGINLGAILALDDHWALLASGGPGIDHGREGGQYSGYGAVRLTF